MMTAQVATTRIVRGLAESEAEIDRALASSATLLATLVSARIETGEAAATGQVAIMRLTRSLMSLSDARKDLVQAHAELRKIGEVRSDIIFPDESKGSSIEQFEAELFKVAA